MNSNFPEEQVFINRLTKITEANLKNEQFGVSELAREFGMSRSYIYRHLKAITNQSISQFICRVRLEKAMEMLRQNVSTAAEIAYEVGFSSPAYFSHCFHKHYGFPPGEVKTQFIDIEKEIKVVEDIETEIVQLPENDKKLINTGKKLIRNKIFLISVIVLALFGLTWFLHEKVNTINQEKELSIVVLPFKNLSNNLNNRYFADGITEDILNNLYWITSLRVVSRTTAEKYRESALSAQEIGNELRAKYVLEGSVRHYEDKTRISVQLIDAENDNHIWSSFFDRKMMDIIEVQGEIALQVASKLKTILSEQEIRQIEKIPTQNPKAYDYYLQARFLLHKANSEQRLDFEKEGVMNCIKYYEKAIAEDEDFAEAYAGLASAWFSLTAWSFIPSNEGFLKARELSIKAIEIDPECAEAHAILGAFYIWGQRKFEKGGKECETSIHLNPNFATARQWYAQYLMITGPIEDARKQINYALELEPYFWVIQNLNAWIYYFEKKHDKAIKACMVAHDLKPDFIESQWLFFLNYAKLGEGEKATEKLQEIVRLYPKAENYADEISKAFKQSGIKGLFSWLVDVNQNKPIPLAGMGGHPFFIAWWNAILGNKEQTIYWLEKNMESKKRLYAYFNLIATNPDFEFLHDDPRFLKIVDDIGLTSFLN